MLRLTAGRGGLPPAQLQGSTAQTISLMPYGSDAGICCASEYLSGTGHGKKEQR